MINRDIFIIRMFEKFCPNINHHSWSRIGTNTMCISMGPYSDEDIFFTYIDDFDWKIETKSMFERSNGVN